MDKVSIDLVRDFKAMAESELKEAGIAWDSALDTDDFCSRYLDLKRRWPSPSIRVVHKAKEFRCPPELQPGLRLIEQKLAKGEDIKAHLSTRLSKFTYNDAMLNAWGVLHLHLGDTLMSNGRGFVKRTGPLLYAMFNSADAYFIQVFDHHSFSKQEIVDIIDENWPSIIEPWHLGEVKGFAFDPSDDDVKALRNLNVNVSVSARSGRKYAPMGGGVALDGSSMVARMSWIRWKKRAKDIEQYIHQYDGWPQDLANECSKPTGDVRWRLYDVSSSQIRLINENSGVILKF